VSRLPLAVDRTGRRYYEPVAELGETKADCKTLFVLIPKDAEEPNPQHEFLDTRYVVLHTTAVPTKRLELDITSYQQRPHSRVGVLVGRWCETKSPHMFPVQSSSDSEPE
jgi:hypothetical protein